MMKKPWKEPTLDDLLADPILDLLLARDGVSREELLAVVEQARLALAAAARNRLFQREGPASAGVLPLWPVAIEPVFCLTR